MRCIVWCPGVALLLLNAQEAGQGEQRGYGGGNIMMRGNRVGVGGKGNGRSMREKAECDGKGL